MKSIVFLFILIATIGNAQKNLVLEESKDIIRRAYDLQQDSKFEEAIEEYDKVSINDTNYAVAQYEIGRSYVDLKNSKEARKVLYKLIEDDIKFEFQNDVYTVIGMSYLVEKDSINALRVYNEGIVKFPMDFRLYYNRALVHEKMKNFDLAVEDYKNCIQRNIYYAPAHLQLAILAANEERFAEATFGFATYFILEPTNEKALKVARYAEQMANGSYTPESKNFDLSKSDSFEAINLLYKNKVALDKKYKVKFTSPTDFGKQLHFICANAKYNDDDKDFWNQNYLPLFQKIFNSGKLDDLVMLSLVMVESPDVAKKIKAKTPQLKSFIQWLNTVYTPNYELQYFLYEGEIKKVYMNYEDSRLRYFGPQNAEGKAEGTYYHYHTDGSLMLVSQFKDDEPYGTLKFYNGTTGKMFKKFTYDENSTKDRTEEYFYNSGELYERYYSKSGVIEDTVFFFYRNGTIKEKIAIKNGKRNGELTEYYANGKLSYKGTYKDGKADGNFETFHRNGQLKSEFSYKNDILDGKRTTYFPDGKVETVYNIKEDKYDGIYEEYYPNSKLSEKGTFKNDNNIGELTQYYSNGTLYKRVTLDENGKENGTSVYFDRDEIKYHEIDFGGGDIKEIRFFDKSNKMTVLAKKKGKTIDYVFNFPGGNKEVEGKIVDGQRDGNWTYYDYYGNIYKTEKYDKGTIIDEILIYHPNGQLREKYTYADGKQNGVYLEYDIFGNLLEEGQYRNGELDKEWYVYYLNGNTEIERYYIAGEMHGFQLNYAVNGKLSSIEEYDEGLEINHEFLDTNGVVIDRIGEFNGNVQLHDAGNTFINFEASFLNGENNGKLTTYAPNKQPLARGQYENNLKTGKWEWFYANGKVEETGTYINGQVHGPYTEYHENGKISLTKSYLFGVTQGEFKFFYEDGKPKLVGNALDAERHGKNITYGPDGGITLIRNYDNGAILSYSYIGTDGKEVPPILAKKEADSLITYHKNGKVAIRSYRVSGLLEGMYEVFYENGQVFEREYYKFGDLHGESKMYYPNGTIKEESNYKFDAYDGVQKTYYPNGKLKSQQTYNLGEAHGPKLEYSADGKLTLTSIYYNNELISIK